MDNQILTRCQVVDEMRPVLEEAVRVFNGEPSKELTARAIKLRRWAVEHRVEKRIILKVSNSEFGDLSPSPTFMGFRYRSKNGLDSSKLFGGK